MATKTLTKIDWRTEFLEIVATATRKAQSEAHAMTGQGRWEDLYLWHRPGALMATSYELGEPWQREAGTRIHAGIPYAQYFQIIHDAARRLPILTE